MRWSSLAEGGGQLHVEIRVAIAGTVQRRLPHAPLLGIGSGSAASDGVGQNRKKAGKETSQTFVGGFIGVSSFA